MTASFTPLAVSDVPALLRLHAASSPGYSRHFNPFRFDQATLYRILGSRERDLYYAARWDDVVAGFYMLRGWDEGYARPAYGVWISQAYSGRGLARASLHHATSVCRSRGTRELMLKVHPDNTRARHVYEAFGFSRAGTDEVSGDWVYLLKLPTEA